MAFMVVHKLADKGVVIDVLIRPRNVFFLCGYTVRSSGWTVKLYSTDSETESRGPSIRLGSSKCEAGL